MAERETDERDLKGEEAVEIANEFANVHVRQGQHPHCRPPEDPPAPPRHPPPPRPIGARGNRRTRPGSPPPPARGPTGSPPRMSKTVEMVRGTAPPKRRRRWYPV